MAVFLRSRGRCRFMILLIIRIKVPSEKRMELSQTLASLSVSIMMAKGCKRYDFCQSMEDKNQLFLLEEWDTDVFFFFQAEDGIRDWSVTGVQTCALPI